MIITRKRRWDEDWDDDADATDEVTLRSDDYHNIRIPTKLTQKIGKTSFEIVVDGENIKAR